MTSQINIAALKAVNLAASNEETRYYLRGVYLTVTARNSTYVATNGHILLAHCDTLEKDAPANDVLGSWIIPAEAISKLKAPKHNPAGTLQALDKDRLLIESQGVETVVRPIDGSFPDWRRVLPPACDPKALVSRAQFDPTLLAVFGKAAKALDIDPKFVNVHTIDAGSPAAVTFGKTLATFGCIMPVRGASDLWAGAPNWASATPPAPVAQAAE